MAILFPAKEPSLSFIPSKYYGRPFALKCVIYTQTVSSTEIRLSHLHSLHIIREVLTRIALESWGLRISFSTYVRRLEMDYACRN